MDDAVFGSSVELSYRLALVAWMTPSSGHPCSRAMAEGFFRDGMDDVKSGSEYWLTPKKPSIHQTDPHTDPSRSCNKHVSFVALHG